MTRLVVWFLAKSEGLVFPLPYPEAGGQVWHFGHSKAQPQVTILHPGMGGVVWTILLVTNSELKPPPLGLASL